MPHNDTLYPTLPHPKSRLFSQGIPDLKLFTRYSQTQTRRNPSLYLSEAALYVDLVLRTADYNFFLPEDLIAQTPAPARDASRLLVFKRPTGATEHRYFFDFPGLLVSGDVLVINNSRVIPARLRAQKRGGGAIEVLLLEEVDVNDWWVMLKPGKRAPAGAWMQFRSKSGELTAIEAETVEKSLEGHYRLRFNGTANIKNELDRVGEIPLPPYIRRPDGIQTSDADRYQTVFAQPPGSVAAPTAGLHFTPQMLEEIRRNNIEIAEVTLHVGPGTFAPVKTESITDHRMHEERYIVNEHSARVIASAKSEGRRVIAVGTTSLRVLESVAAAHGQVVATSGKTRLFVYPPYDFKVVDALLTNFHLPESTLLMLVSAFPSPGGTEGRRLVLNAYEEAVRERYRFFSYGDAMFIL